MSGRYRLRKSLQNFGNIKENKKNYFPGILGFLINSQQIVEVPGRESYVYVRLRDNLSEVIQAFNASVSPVYGLPVLVSRDTLDPTRYVIVERDTGRYDVWQTTSSFLPKHGVQHSFEPSIGGGGDIVWVYDRQFMPLLVTPSGSNGAGSVNIQSDIYYWQGNWRFGGGTGTPSLLPAKPTNNQAKLLLIYLDGNGNPAIATGSLFNASLTGTAEIMPYIPGLPVQEGIPLAAARLVSGTSVILWDNLYDLRPFMVNMVTGTNAGGSTLSAFAIYDDGVFKVSGTHISFDKYIGVYASGSRASAYVEDGWFAFSGHAHPSDNWNLLIYDDGIFKATGTVIDFLDNLTVITSGTSIFVSSSGGGGGGNNVLPVYDDSIFKITGSLISFDANLSVANSGSNAFVNVVGGSGSGLDADLLDGNHAIAFASGSHTHPSVGSAIAIYDDSIFKVTGTAISFESGLVVSVTGSVAYVASTVSSSTGSSSFSPDPTFFIDGLLVITTGVAGAYISPRSQNIDAVYIYCDYKGITGSTIVDINKNGTTIFTAQGNRPTLLYNDADNYAKGIPDVVGLVEGDILTLDIDQVATNAEELSALVSFKATGTSGGGAGSNSHTTIFTMPGILLVENGPLRIYNVFGTTQTITKVFLSVNTAPLGSAIIVDVHKNGTTIFTNQAHRPQILGGANTGYTVDIDVPSWADGDYLQIDVDQVGAITPGANLTIHILHS